MADEALQAEVVMRNSIMNDDTVPIAYEAAAIARPETVTRPSRLRDSSLCLINKPSKVPI